MKKNLNSVLYCNKYCKNWVQQPKPTQNSGALYFNPNPQTIELFCVEVGRQLQFSRKLSLRLVIQLSYIEEQIRQFVVDGKKSSPLSLPRKSSYISLTQVFIKLYTVQFSISYSISLNLSSGQKRFSNELVQDPLLILLDPQMSHKYNWRNGEYDLKIIKYDIERSLNMI